MNHSLYSLDYAIDTGHSKSATEVRVLPDGVTVATCSADATIRIFNFKTGALITTLKGHTKGINTIEYLPINSDILALGLDDFTIRLWSVSRGKCIKVLKKHTYHVTALKFTSRGNVLVLGGADETIIVWDLVSGKTLHTMAAHSDPILLICLSHDDTIIALGGYDGIMRLFDTELGQCVKTLTVNSSHGTATALTADVINHPISSVIMSPNSKYIFSSSLDGYIRLWEYSNNKVCKTYGEGSIAAKYCCGTAIVTDTELPLLVLGSESQGVLVFDVQSRQTTFEYPCDDVVILVMVYEGDIVALTMGGKLFRLKLNPEFIHVAEAPHLQLPLLVLEPREATADSTSRVQSDADVEMDEAY